MIATQFWLAPERSASQWRATSPGEVKPGAFSCIALEAPPAVAPRSSTPRTISSLRFLQLHHAGPSSPVVVLKENGGSRRIPEFFFASSSPPLLSFYYSTLLYLKSLSGVACHGR